MSTGHPADEITKAARRLRSDLIVMGTQGLTGAKKLFLGSTAQRVLECATVPVLVIPRGAPRRLRPAR